MWVLILPSSRMWTDEVSAKTAVRQPLLILVSIYVGLIGADASRGS